MSAEKRGDEPTTIESAEESADDGAADEPLAPLLSVADLTPDPLNANMGTERGRAALEHSLATYGAGRSVLADKHGRLIAGNKTIEVGGALGLPIRVVESDGTEIIVVRRRDLDLATDPAARELAFADNRVAQLDLSWDPGALKDAIAETALDLGALFTPLELDNLIANAPNGASARPEPTAPGAFKEYDGNLATEHRCPKCGYEF